jgi:hypothetical protein
MWPFKGKEKSDMDETIEVLHQTRDQTDPAHRMQVYYCQRNCRSDGRIGLMRCQRRHRLLAVQTVAN